MSILAEIKLERDSANDEHATVVGLYAASGSAVRRADHLFDVESSKATQEITAPADGILTHALNIGDEVPFGITLATIVAADGEAGTSPAEKIPAAVAGAPRSESKPIFSRAAAALAREHGLSIDEFTEPFVTEAAVKARLSPAHPASPVTDNALAPSARAHHRGERVSLMPRKRDEIKALSGGAGNSMLSVLGLRLGTIAFERARDDMLTGRITDLVVYEASRLMRKYPNLNAAFADGMVERAESVHAGLALDGPAGLVVYGIADADRKDLTTIRNDIADGMERYSERRLTAEELTRATFTITDLSGTPLDFVFPLLPIGQSCIIGVTTAAASGFHLYIGYDHRVTTGSEVGAFLGDLHHRLKSFDRGGSRDEPRCYFCDKAASDEVRMKQGKGLLRLVGEDGQERLCCYACWAGL